MRLEFGFAKFEEIARELGATEKDFRAALRRACHRTAASLRVYAAREARTKLELQKVAAIRRRIKSLLKQKGAFRAGVWFGLNDMPVSLFEGTPAQSGRGADFHGRHFPGGFVRKSRRNGARKTIYKRLYRTRYPIEEQSLPIQEKFERFLEHDMLHIAEKMLWRHFESDLDWRVRRTA